MTEIINRKSHGYGTWDVTCPKCGNTRALRGYKFKSNGVVRGSENRCHPCRAIALQKRTAIKCPGCGLERILKRADARERLSHYCKRCVKVPSLANRRKNGERHANVTSRGYVIVLGMKGHQLAKRWAVHEHWLTLYEQHPMGPESVLWFQKQGFTVHHKNGKRDDNSLENLELRAPGKHPHGWSIEDMEEVVRRFREVNRVP